MTTHADATRFAATALASALELDATPAVTSSPIDGGWRFAPVLAGSTTRLGGIEIAVRARDGAHAWISTGTTDDDAAALLADAPPR